MGALGQLLKAAGDSPEGKEAASNLGTTAVTITRTINNALLPLAALNFGIEKARKYFEEKFSTEMAEKISEIPEDEIQEPKASVAGPALQGLAFTHEEQNLKEMFLNLLASSMDARHSERAHPAFVEVIKQLVSEEAAMVQKVLEPNVVLPVVRVFVREKSSGGMRTKISHLMAWTNLETGEPIEEIRMPAMVDNWIRLGLVNVAYDRQLSGESYDWVSSRPEYIEVVSGIDEETHQVDFTRGIIYGTDFGKQFAEAVS